MRRARLQDDVHHGGTHDIRAEVIAGHARQLPADRRVQAPALAALCLQHKHLHVVVVQRQPLPMACASGPVSGSLADKLDSSSLCFKHTGHWHHELGDRTPLCNDLQG